MKNINLVYGVGINDADYKTTRQSLSDDGKTVIEWKCPYYYKWVSMLMRCYSELWHNKYPRYRECSVVYEWLRFSNFRAWMEQQDYVGKELDKDLLLFGNKVYGPDYCIFVDREVNVFISEYRSKVSNLPVGVYYELSRGIFKASCFSVVDGKQKTLGRFATPEEAHEAWLKFKLQQAVILAAEQTDERVAKALIDRYVNYGNLPKAA